MIFRHVYGKVLETEAVLNKPEPTRIALPRLAVDETAMTFTCTLAEEERVYGLGENVRGINRRGWIFESRCADDPHHLEDRRSLYGAHNFILLDGAEPVGFFFDYPGILRFDVGYTKRDTLTVTASDWNLEVYVITGTSAKDIVHQFRRLIGRSYAAPRWALGYGQSRWGYRNAEDVRTVVRRHRELGLPLDSVYMDIDYMDNYKDFTVDPERFPDFPAFVEEMKAQHIHLVPIIDAAVKMENGYRVCEEGLEKGYFCTKEDGSPFLAAVWPGLSLFPDTMNPEARAWFGDQYRVLLDAGIEGFWNDMNEPAIFYTEDRLKHILKEISGLQGKKLDLEQYWYFRNLVEGMDGNTEDYKVFWHRVGEERIRHDRVHNLYGYGMTRAAGEAFDRLSPDRRVLLFSRASYIGMHRYGGIWQGDNCSYWSHLLMNLKMLPSLNMCGFLYTGADLGGFGADTTEDLMLRWLALGIFTPLMRNHSCMGTREQEAYQFHDLDAFRSILGLRYRLLPYIYSEYMKAVLRDEMMFRPLAFDYPEDRRAVRIEDQLMVGEELMIAPVLEQNAVGRMVYLPETMKQLRFRRDGSVEETVLSAGDHYVEIPLDEVVFFLREGRCLPLSRGGEYADQVNMEDLQLITFPGRSGVLPYEYYCDDGYGRDLDDPGHIRILRG